MCDLLGIGIIASFVVGIIICIVIVIHRVVTWRYETMHDVATVIDKKFDDHFALQLATKSYPLGLYNEYDVYILYKGKKYCLSGKDLYEKVKVGDTVRVLVHKGFNKQGKLKDTYFTIED